MRSAVEVRGLSKNFRLPRSRPPTLKASLVAALGRHRPAPDCVRALRALDFTVERGSCLGIIGHNGAGKSTLLRLLCGVGRPTEGTVRVEGRTAGVLTLGTGFHGDLTGRENLGLGAVLNGMTRAEAAERQSTVIRFAELEDVIDHPLRTYSTGMYLRLAFSTAVHSDPAVLIIDEVLAVGDASFQKRCLDKLQAFRRAGGTMVVASHVPEQLEALCDQVLILENGCALALDAPRAALDTYAKRVQEGKGRSPAEGASVGSRSGTREAVVTKVRTYDAEGRVTDTLDSGLPATFELGYECSRPLEDLAFTVGIFCGATKCFELGIDSLKRRLGHDPAPRGTVRCRVESLPLAAGSYALNVGVHGPAWNQVYDYHWHMHRVDIVERDRVGRECATGWLAARAEWSVDTAPPKLTHG